MFLYVRRAGAGASYEAADLLSRASGTERGVARTGACNSLELFYYWWILKKSRSPS